MFVPRSTIHEAQVHRALWLWANGYITKESHDAAKGTKRGGILKAMGPDGKCTKITNFSKEQWDEVSDIHVRDAWSVEQEKLRVIQGDIDTAINTIRDRKMKKRKASGPDSSRVAKKGRCTAYEHRIVSSDSDIWYRLIYFCGIRSNASLRLDRCAFLFYLHTFSNHRSLLSYPRRVVSALSFESPWTVLLCLFADPLGQMYEESVVTSTN